MLSTGGRDSDVLSAWVVHLFEDVRAPSKSAAAVLSNLIEGPEISHEDETVSPQCLIPSCSRLNSVRRFVRHVKASGRRLYFGKLASIH